MTWITLRALPEARDQWGLSWLGVVTDGIAQRRDHRPWPGMPAPKSAATPARVSRSCMRSWCGGMYQGNSFLLSGFSFENGGQNDNIYRWIEKKGLPAHRIGLRVQGSTGLSFILLVGQALRLRPSTVLRTSSGQALRPGSGQALRLRSGQAQDKSHAFTIQNSRINGSDFR